VLNLANEIYTTFGLTYTLELSTRPEKNTIGSDQEWETATAGLKGALDQTKLPYRINEGDGAFYGPKIDFHITDALDRSWQCGTVQLDYNLPSGTEYSRGEPKASAGKEVDSGVDHPRFDLTYKGADNLPHRPVMIHRALLGSFERMIGVLTEHWAGAFPLWLAPEQVRVLPVTEAFEGYAREVKAKLFDKAVRVEVDASPDKVAKRVRDAALAKVPYILVVGEKEQIARTVTVRGRGSEKQTALGLDAFVERVLGEIARRERAPEETWGSAAPAGAAP
jgi:threonyl-tRNA synthetase